MDESQKDAEEFQLYEVLEKAKLTLGDRKQIRDCLSP